MSPVNHFYVITIRSLRRNAAKLRALFFSARLIRLQRRLSAQHSELYNSCVYTRRWRPNCWIWWTFAVSLTVIVSCVLQTHQQLRYGHPTRWHVDNDMCCVVLCTETHLRSIAIVVPRCGTFPLDVLTPLSPWHPCLGYTTILAEPYTQL